MTDPTSAPEVAGRVLDRELAEAVARKIDPAAWVWIDRTSQSDPAHIALELVRANSMKRAFSALDVVEGWNGSERP